MPRRLLSLPHLALTALSFALAAVLMLGVSWATSLVIEHRAGNAVRARMAEARIDWVSVEPDGMLVNLSGTAPNEAARFRAISLAGSVINSQHIRDTIEVTPATAVSAPRFSLEMLRNDAGVQLIGLLPELPDADGLTRDALVEAARPLSSAGNDPADLLQTAAWPAPEGWDRALRFALSALELLKRSKISVSAERVEITAIAASIAEKRHLENELARRKPDGLELVAEISAPRPVITPFTLRFIIDADGARFDACSADTEAARERILAAAVAAGISPPGACTVGMGAPSPRWSEGVNLGIAAVKAMGLGNVTFSDMDVTLTAGEGVTQDAFDSAVGELRASLPDVFSLDTVAPRAADGVAGPAEFTASRTSGGRILLRGKLVDAPQQTAVTAYARAAFGGAPVQVATRLDPELPDGWPLRVLAGLESLAVLDDGSLLVQPDFVELKGVTGSQEARARITQILSQRLGQGQRFRVDVRYDEALDPLAALPTPQECAQRVVRTMGNRKISFAPASAEITSDANPLLEELAKVLADCPALPLEIAGHTDSQGSEGGNRALSQARAEAVLMALQGRRVDVSAMTAIGYGEAHPIADNGNEEGREANRRIEFVLKLKSGATPAAPAPRLAAPTPEQLGLPEDDIILEDIVLGDDLDAEGGLDEGEGEGQSQGETEAAPDAPAPPAGAVDAPLDADADDAALITLPADAPTTPPARLAEVMPNIPANGGAAALPDLAADADGPVIVAFRRPPVTPPTRPARPDVSPEPQDDDSAETADVDTGSEASSPSQISNEDGPVNVITGRPPVTPPARTLPAGADAAPETPEAETPAPQLPADPSTEQTDAATLAVPDAAPEDAILTEEQIFAIEAPDFSHDTSPSLAPKDMTLRPRTRPASR